MKKVISISLILIMMFTFNVQTYAVDDIGHSHSYYTVDVYEIEGLNDTHWHIYTMCYIYESFRVVVTHCNCGSTVSTSTSLGLRHDLW